MISIFCSNNLEVGNVEQLKLEHYALNLITIAKLYFIFIIYHISRSF